MRAALRRSSSLAVVCHCLLILGIIFSTVSAQPNCNHGSRKLPPALPLNSLYSGPSCRRRESGDDDSTAGSDDGEPAACYARYSSANQREASIADQLRVCRDAVAKNGHYIPDGLVFSDEAISGTKRHRRGLNAMLAAAEDGQFATIYFHSLSRLSRESVITLPLVKRLVHKHRVRIVSVADGLDTDSTGWQIMMSVFAIVHEQQLRDLSANVHRGQAGTVLSGYASGSHCYGYASESVNGTESSKRGGNAQPKRRYVIDEDRAPWVCKIFRWFVEERRSIRWIARKLNKLKAPKSKRSRHDRWYPNAVFAILRNPKYVGVWRWGVTRNVRDPETGDVRQVPRTPEEYERWTQEFPDLRIIDEDTYRRAQEILDESAKEYAPRRWLSGKLRGSKRGCQHGQPRHLLAGLVKCANCGASFIIAGTHGEYLECGNKRIGAEDVCNVRTMLNRRRAEGMILDAIGQQILANDEWLRVVHEELKSAWSSRDAELPAALASAEQSHNDLKLRIERLVDSVEAGEADPDIHSRLSRRRADLAEIEREIAQLRRRQQSDIPEPTLTWLKGQLQNLGQQLRETTPAAALALGRLVGGAIVVQEMAVDGKVRKFFRATVRISRGRVVSILAGGDDTSDKGDDSTMDEITIDFIAERASDKLALKAKELLDQGLTISEIEAELGVYKGKVRRLLKRAGKLLGVDIPDGRAVYRRALRERRKAEEEQTGMGEPVDPEECSDGDQNAA
ncbi:MAG: hypothetical protein DWQ34_27025 [Planctomycetota bacterium]|nr:MAG: hypothetical protein DWQ34_27025 [Planctomycetota bacterium]REK28453.1 MAG: hypothetical protein DWQ41_05745 [Planctomycetota bacterium]REK29128.1 MAG: hypothetical protein DWQ45_23590 [Planctomycetota bacterium]